MWHAHVAHLRSQLRPAGAAGERKRPGAEPGVDGRSGYWGGLPLLTQCLGLPPQSTHGQCTKLIGIALTASGKVLIENGEVANSQRFTGHKPEPWPSVAPSSAGSRAPLMAVLQGLRLQPLQFVSSFPLSVGRATQADILDGPNAGQARATRTGTGSISATDRIRPLPYRRRTIYRPAAGSRP